MSRLIHTTISNPYWSQFHLQSSLMITLLVVKHKKWIMRAPTIIQSPKPHFCTTRMMNNKILLPLLIESVQRRRNNSIWMHCLMISSWDGCLARKLLDLYRCPLARRDSIELSIIGDLDWYIWVQGQPTHLPYMANTTTKVIFVNTQV